MKAVIRPNPPVLDVRNAAVVRTWVGGQDLWLIRECPFCGGRHYHNAPELGMRRPHCNLYLPEGARCFLVEEKPGLMLNDRYYVRPIMTPKERIDREPIRV